MNTKYINYGGSQYIVSDGNNINVFDNLPAATYEVVYNEDQRRYELVTINDMENMPKKVYGDPYRFINRILTSYKNKSNKNTGILLSGTKGSGKSLTTRMLAKRAIEELCIPVIIINQSYDTVELARFIQKISDDVMIVFDEFDKTYGCKEDERKETKQRGLLSILDGVYESHKLFLFIVNEERNVSDFMISRPGRILYHLHYGDISYDTVKEMCNDNLLNKDFTNDVLKIVSLLSNVSYDIINTIINECNIFNESPVNFIDILNVNLNLKGMFEVKLYDNVNKEYLGSNKTSLTNACCIDFEVHDKRSKYRLNNSFINEDEDELQKKYMNDLPERFNEMIRIYKDYPNKSFIHERVVHDVWEYFVLRFKLNMTGINLFELIKEVTDDLIIKTYPVIGDRYEIHMTKVETIFNNYEQIKNAL